MTRLVCITGAGTDPDGVCLEHGERACVVEVDAGPRRHGDFGDLSRYDVTTDARGRLCVRCLDHGIIARWEGLAVSLADLGRAAAEHETEEETP